MLATAAAMAAPASEVRYGSGAQFGAASSLAPPNHMRGMPAPLAMPMKASDLPGASTQEWSGLKKDKGDVEPMSCGLLYYVHIPKTGGSTVFDRLQKVGWAYNRLYWGDDGPAEENKWVADPERWKNSSGWKWAHKILAAKRPKIILEAHHGAPGLEYMVNNVLGDMACALKAKGCQLRVVTVLRSPVERMASTLVFNEHGMPNETKTLSLLERGADEQTRYLLKGHTKQWTNPKWRELPSPKSVDAEVVSRAQNVLSYAYLVGNSRRLDEFMGQVYTLLGVDKPADAPNASNVTPDDADIPKELKGALWRATQSDRSLFFSWLGGQKRPRQFKELCRANLHASPSPSPTTVSAQPGKAEADAPILTLRWNLANKTECPAGQRNAAEDECLPAAQEAAASVGLELQGPMRWVNDGPTTVVPSGCSYSRVSKSALFNYNVAGANQLEGTPGAYPLVCIDDPEFAAVSVIRNGDEKAQRSAQGQGQSCGGCLSKHCLRTVYSDPAACLSCSREQCAVPVCMPEDRHQHCGAEDLKATHDYQLSRPPHTSSPSPLPSPPKASTHAVAAAGCVSVNEAVSDYWCQTNCWTWETAGDVRGGPSNAGICPPTMCKCDAKQEEQAHAQKEADSHPAMPSPEPLVTSSPEPAPEQAGEQASETVCKSLVDSATDLWCDENCESDPNAQWCEPACRCPGYAAAEAEQRAVESEPRLPDPNLGLARHDLVPKAKDGGNHGMTEGVDPNVLSWIGDEDLPEPEDNPQTAHTFMPSIYSNPYLEKLEKSRANGEPDPSPEPSQNPNDADPADSYLKPKDATTCVSNNPRSVDSWCRDMCGAGVCTAEMCACDGDADADADKDADKDADASNDTLATHKSDLLWVPQVPSSNLDLDDFGESYPDRNVRDDVPSDVPVEVIGPEMPDAEPMSQWDKSLAGDVPVGIVADESPAPRPLSDFESWHGDIFDAGPDQEPEPSPAPVASPVPKAKVLDTSAGPLGGGMPSGIPLPVIAEESYVTPSDPLTCVSMSESATDDWCVDACEAGMCSAQMCKCDEDANLVLARRGPFAKDQLLPNDDEQSHAKHADMHTGSYESLTHRTANFVAPASNSPKQQQAVREVALITGPAQAATMDTPRDILA